MSRDTQNGNDFIIGLGANIINKKPSVGLSDVIRDSNERTFYHLPYLSGEEVPAATLNTLEQILSVWITKTHEWSSFMSQFFKCWMQRGKYVFVCALTKSRERNDEKDEGLRFERELALRQPVAHF
ncbi:uncharacterized protein [Oscarella lobularis]|uniref:uncharacterized protein n=1 Tax=Oscarella lobularis TaxID=121494 RepID=UPI00331333B9